MSSDGGRDPNQRNLGLLLGVIGGLVGMVSGVIAIITFITGVPDLPQFLSGGLATPTAAARMFDAAAPNEGSEPTKASRVTSTPIPAGNTPRKVCSDAPETQLEIGMQVVVASYPPQGNNVRREPNTSSAVVFIIYPKQTATITDGPQCAAGYVWWKIQTPTNKQGWTAEGDFDNYWINPRN